MDKRRSPGNSCADFASTNTNYGVYGGDWTVGSGKQLTARVRYRNGGSGKIRMFFLENSGNAKSGVAGYIGSLSGCTHTNASSDCSVSETSLGYDGLYETTLNITTNQSDTYKIYIGPNDDTDPVTVCGVEMWEERAANTQSASLSLDDSGVPPYATPSPRSLSGWGVTVTDDPNTHGAYSNVCANYSASSHNYTAQDAGRVVGNGAHLKARVRYLNGGSGKIWPGYREGSGNVFSSVVGTIGALGSCTNNLASSSCSVSETSIGNGLYEAIMEITTNESDTYKIAIGPNSTSGAAVTVCSIELWEE